MRGLFCLSLLFGRVPAKGADAGFIDAPFVGTGDASVQAFARLIASCLTFWTGATGMEPLPVGIKAILDSIVGDFDTVEGCELEGFVPGLTLHSNQLDVF
ncbi:MAG: hypothetical protein JWO99_128 [Candidatus Saccharibacteria bacterium]|nr:hypothetical protein [Candidatus Saccharibacteria bacterium]